jgi:hypothetical protein
MAEPTPFPGCAYRTAPRTPPLSWADASSAVEPIRSVAAGGWLSSARLRRRECRLAPRLPAWADWQVGVGEPVDGGEHVGEDVRVEAEVVLSGPPEKAVPAVAVGEGVDVGEISRRYADGLGKAGSFALASLARTSAAWGCWMSSKMASACCQASRA